MVQVEALLVLFQEAQRFSVGMLHMINDVIRLGEVDLIVVPDDLTLALSLQAHFDDVPGLIVEQTMRVPQPRDCSEKHYRLLHGILNHHLVVLAHLLVLSLLGGSIGVVSVHIVGIISRRHLDQ